MMTITRFPLIPVGKRRISFGLWLLIATWLVAACQKETDGVPAPSKPSISPATERALDAYLTDYLDQYHLTGLSVAITRGDELLWSKGYGLANKQLNLPVTDQTVFMTASISKTVVAVAVMQLVEKGAIDLDADINQYLDFRVSNPRRPDAVITCRQLMTHTSGIVDDYYGELVSQNPYDYYFDTDPPLSLGEICRAFLSQDGNRYSATSFSAGAPGSPDSYSYSNLGATLLAYLVERAAGQPFTDYTRQHIFAPLGMRKTSWRIGDFTPDEMANMYQADGTAYGNYTIALFPAGGLRTTVTDLSLYLRAIAVGGTLAGKQILLPASIAEMTTPRIPLDQGLSLGLIWSVATIGDYRNLRGYYLGQSEGLNTQLFYDPDKKTGAIVFINQDFQHPADVVSISRVTEKLLSVAGNPQ